MTRANHLSPCMEGSHNFRTVVNWATGSVTKSTTVNSLLPGFWRKSGTPIVSSASFFNDPNWKVKVRKLQDASHAYTLSSHRFFSRNVCNITSQYWAPSPGTGFKYYDEGGYAIPGGDPVENIPLDSALDDIALSRLKNRLSSMTGMTNVLIPIGEIKETQHLMRDVIHSFGGVVKNLLTIKDAFRKRKEQFARAADAWLTYSFAVSPTISDINSTAHAIAVVLNRTDLGLTRIYGASSKTWLSNYVKNYTPGQGNCTIKYKERLEHELKYMYVAGVKLNLLNTTDYSVSKALGLNFGSMVPAFWELVPYSWLVDYFSTVGAFLNDTFTSQPGVTTYVTKTITYRCMMRGSGDVVANNPLVNIQLDGSVPYINKESFLQQRTVLSSLPHRSLRIKTLDEIGLGALTKVTNLASLLARR